AFISQNISIFDSATLSTSKKLADSFNGLYLSLDQTSAPANGAAIAFNPSTAGAARVDIYYRTTNSSGTLDTTVVSFPINGASGAAATEIKWDVSPEVQTELNNTTTNNAKLFLKGLAGTKVKVSFPQSELDRLK